MKKLNQIKAVKIFLFAFLLSATGITNAQVGIGTKTPAVSAQLDVSSTTKGLLPPRMTNAQRDAIVSPAAGLTIWCNDCGVLGEIQVYNGAAWSNMIGSQSASPLAKSVAIGTQDWMTKNLDVTTYRNGDTIPQVTDPAQWNKQPGGAWCYYNNDPAKGAVYGKLYNRTAIMDSRGLAPNGWRVPDNDEWNRLGENLGGETEAGNKMRATFLWGNANVNPMNEVGFTGLPGGTCNDDGSFDFIGRRGEWWSTSEEEEGHSLYAESFYFGYILDANGFYKNRFRYSSWSHPAGNTYDPVDFGFSVRCIKDWRDLNIGNQVWMSTNLNVQTYKNGNPIPQVTNPNQWDTLTTGAWCYYGNYPPNGAIYGKLYNWYAVHDPRGLAPEGYHVASDEEWNTLINNLGGASLAGYKLKEQGTTHWQAPNDGVDNTSGFTALPGGKFVREVNNPTSVFTQMEGVGSWWTSSGTTTNPNTAWYREMNYYDGKVSRWAINKKTGFSVRCIKN